MIRLASLLLPLTLMACSAGDGLSDLSEPADDRFARLSRAGAPAMIASAEDRGGAGALALSARNGQVTTWLSADNTTLSFREGLLVATRGLGGDLMSADIAGPLALIRQGGSGLAVRIHRYLDGEDQTRILSFVCDVSSRGMRTIAVGDQRSGTRLMQERCVGADTEFQNLYWILPATGEIVQSRQWAGPRTGYLALRKISP